MSAINNARWIAASQAAKIVVQFVSVAILARLLTPHDYGLIAMVFVVGNLAGQLRDMGTAAAIVHDPQLTPATINAVFWLNVALGATLSLVLLVIAGPVAAMFRAEDVGPLLSVLAPSFLITSIGAVPRALLERRSAFSIVAGIEIATAFVGLLVSVVAAWLGAGAASFVYGLLSQSVLSTVALWKGSAWMPGRIAGSDRLGALLKFSGNLSVFNLITYVSRNADSFVVGRYLGAAALGIYSNAYKVMLLPLHNMTYVANRALFPVMCRFETTAQMRSLYFKSVSVIALLTAPLMTGIFVLREPFIRTLLGPQWSAAADVLLWLAPVGFLQSIVSTTGTVSMVRGRTDLLMRVGLFSASLYVAAFLIGVRWGVLGVAACYAIANLFGAVPALLVAVRQLDAKLPELLREVWAACACAVLMGIGVWGLEQWLITTSLSEPLRLIAGVATGVLIYWVLLLLLFPARLRLAFSLVPELRKR